MLLTYRRNSNGSAGATAHSRGFLISLIFVPTLEKKNDPCERVLAGLESCSNDGASSMTRAKGEAGVIRYTCTLRFIKVWVLACEPSCSSFSGQVLEGDSISFGIRGSSDLSTKILHVHDYKKMDTSKSIGPICAFLAVSVRQSLHISRAYRR